MQTSREVEESSPTVVAAAPVFLVSKKDVISPHTFPKYLPASVVRNNRISSSK